MKIARFDANGDTELHPSAVNARLLASSADAPRTPWRRWTIPVLIPRPPSLIPAVNSPLRPAPRFYPSCWIFFQAFSQFAMDSTAGHSGPRH